MSQTNSIQFTLKSHGMVFLETKRYEAAGFIPSIHGVSLCGRYQTTARIADIDLVPVPTDEKMSLRDIGELAIGSVAMVMILASGYTFWLVTP